MFFGWHEILLSGIICNMREYSTIMTRIKNDLVSVGELKRLLITVTDHKMGVCFRYRMLGEMWYPNFLRILKVTDEGVLLNDEVKNAIVSIRDLSQVMQFELDSALHQYQPHYHYSVNPYA
jgi:hypothetical protein